MNESLEIPEVFANRKLSLQYTVMLDASKSIYSFNKHQNSNVKSSNI